MSLKSIVVLSAVCVAVLCSSNSFAQGPKGDGDEGKRMMGKMEERADKIFSQLNLTDEQKKLLKENRDKNKAINEEAHKAMKENMKAMGEEIKKKDYDINKVKAIQAQIKESTNAMADKRLDAILEVRKILTQEQFVKFSALMEEKRNSKREYMKEHKMKADKK